MFQTAYAEQWYAEAAFQLHQTTEKLYATLLMVYTGYKPHTHDLEKLNTEAALHEREVSNVFPKETEEQNRLFELLREAYVKGRYNKSYKITREELEWLSKRVERLRELTEKSCRGKIADYAAVAGGKL